MADYKNINIRNKRATFDYEIIEEWIAGIVLVGTEIKSVRLGKASITDSYCYFDKGELWIRGVNIAEYGWGTCNNHVPRRDRKLLLNRKELNKIQRALQDRGLTVVGLRLFLNERGLSKVVVCLARGRKAYDKREYLKENGWNRIVRLFETLCRERFPCGGFSDRRNGSHPEGRTSAIIPLPVRFREGATMSVRRSAGGVWIEKRKKKDMSLILCIETGTDICSVGLARDGELISLRESDQGRDHARQVGVFVDELLSQTGIAPEELDAVAVGKGPGSYTGLRIGVSFAKGLCYGLRIPLVAIGSLDALTEVAKEDYEAGILSVDRWEEACLCPMVDARRMEVYTRVFDAAGTPLSDVSAEVVTAESFAAWRGDGRPFVIFGNGAAKCAGLLPDATLIQVAPSARGLARLAQEALDAGRTEDIAYFEPFYLKDFVVTRSKKKLF